ncbi:uncharacterized protein LOC104858368 isoform X1 [Fukomys damarensis]|uniref:uncharacterized protein LOC104858368 isoform X1 n=1 Tax=Fukomys damarensis TaxID=885580 RepID=UPI00053F89D4|nr:uncharacterized protein LOC104858368 isoform X1 [Fukomys damarensis]XP_010616830.1 uncharacterized protein LOC104858368 isoform X1 [Fukomys damarensis]
MGSGCAPPQRLPLARVPSPRWWHCGKRASAEGPDQASSEAQPGAGPLTTRTGRKARSTQHAAPARVRACACSATGLLLRPGEAPRGSHLLPGPAPLSRSWVGNSSSSPSRLSAWPTTDFAARVELRRTQHGSCTQTPLKSSLSEQQVHPLTLLGFTLSGKSAFLEMLGDTAALDKKIVSTPRQSHVRGLFSSGCYRSREAEGDL